MINVHVKERLVGNWLNNTIKDVEGLYEFKFHPSLQSLKNELFEDKMPFKLRKNYNYKIGEKFIKPFNVSDEKR